VEVAGIVLGGEVVRPREERALVLGPRGEEGGAVGLRDGGRLDRGERGGRPHAHEPDLVPGGGQDHVS
jgi:hypothetical protein